MAIKFKYYATVTVKMKKIERKHNMVHVQNILPLQKSLFLFQ